jgi:hypothetical protein
LNTHLEIRGDLCVALCFGSGSAGGGESGVEGSGGQHLRRRVDEVHWLHDFAVEFGKVDAGDAVVGVGVDAVCLWCLLVLWRGRQRFGITYLHLLCGVVARVEGVGARAGCREKLAAVNSDGCHGEGTVAADHVAAVLPLHDTAGT